MSSAKLISTLLLCMVVTAPMLNIEASIPCHTVTVDLASCLGYLRNGVRVPSRNSSCCKGVQNVKNAARTSKDRRETCVCLKRAAGQYGIVDYKFAAALPRHCGVKIPYHISPSINCKSSIK
ncbi:hypothetical protein SADUNF_Sadunf04G0161600 [Salix dunnii]|uniref:Non-specific lipid-transfer protein n=1 Tax=Salix dunnii TaxID=1413687 RepID=A0A835KCG0_9ROSI|nr:hypothetical protein SADUNF_Sadunf04G0161600 [Salix dunnii]